MGKWTAQKTCAHFRDEHTPWSLRASAEALQFLTPGGAEGSSSVGFYTPQVGPALPVPHSHKEFPTGRLKTIPLFFFFAEYLFFEKT